MLNRIPEKIGEPQILAKGDGKSFLKQTFSNPRTGKIDDFTLFHAETIPVIFMPVTVTGKIVFVDQFRYGVTRVIREFPGGNPKPGQTLEDVIRAELEEETGYTPGAMKRLTPEPIPFEPSSSTIVWWPYLALDCKKAGAPKFDETEFIEIHEVPLSEWLLMLASGKIDTKTIALTHLALPHLGVTIMPSNCL